MLALRPLRAGALVALVAVFTGCSGPASTAGTAAQPCPVLAASNLVYPAPGATDLPAALATIIVSGPVTGIAVTPEHGGTTLTSSTRVALPAVLPSPSVEPVNWETAFAVPTLAPATTYRVTVSDANVAASCPGAGPTTLGEFTTKASP